MRRGCCFKWGTKCYLAHLHPEFCLLAFALLSLKYDFDSQLLSETKRNQTCPGQTTFLGMSVSLWKCVPVSLSSFLSLPLSHVSANTWNVKGNEVLWSWAFSYPLTLNISSRLMFFTVYSRGTFVRHFARVPSASLPVQPRFVSLVSLSPLTWF